MSAEGQRIDSGVGRWLGHRRKGIVALHAVGAVGTLGLMFAVARRLFRHIATVGMDGVDTFTYWKEAKSLLDGSMDFAHLPAAESVNRVTAYALDTFALRLLGANDYAIRAVIGAVDVFNVGLLYLLVLRLARNPLVALLAAALYAQNHWILVYAGTELPHIYGVAFVLLAAHCGLWAIGENGGRRGRLTGAGGAGLFAGAAALTHEDLIVLAAGVGLALVISLVTEPAREPGRESRIFRSLRLVVAFAVGGLAGVLWPMLLVGLSPVEYFDSLLRQWAEADGNTFVRTGGSFLGVASPRVVGDLAFELLRTPVAGTALAVAVLAPAIFLISRANRLRGVIFLEIAIVFYLIVFVFALQVYLEGTYVRILIPVAGLIIACSLAGGYKIARLVLRRLGLPFAACIATALIAAMAGLEAHSLDAFSGHQAQRSPYRRLYDATKDRVTLDKRLLLPGCYPLGWDWVGIGSEVYLGHAVVPVYLARHLAPFDRFAADHAVGYVLVLTDILRVDKAEPEQILRTFSELYGAALSEKLRSTLQPISSQQRPARWWLPQASLELWHGDTRVNWSLEVCLREAELLRSLLTARHARLVTHVPAVGDIYELDRR